VGDFFEGIEHVRLVDFIAHTNVPYGFFTVLHYFTLFFLMGAVVVYDLRLLGVIAKDQTATQFADEVFPWIWTAMTLAIFSGCVLWLCEAGDYYKDPVMLTKIAIVIVAVLETWYIRRNIAKWDEAPTMPGIAKLAAVVSLLLWLGAILAGNDIAAISGLG
jgi:hypothetical protein